MKTFKDYLNEIGEIGYVEEAISYIVYVNGLPGAIPHEIIIFETGDFGQVLSLTQEHVEIIVFSKKSIKAGTKAARTGKLLEIPVGNELLGKTIDPLCNSINEKVITLKNKTYMPLDIVPLGINFRKKISKPFHTGVTLVDLIIPLGKGQRELIIGDRKSGKTNFLLHAALSQAKSGNICIYASIGKKKIDTKKTEEFFLKNNIMDKIIIVATSPHEPSSLIYLTPYTAMTIAEYFKDKERDVLIIFDDLSTHAKFYREISLLSKRFPGRNSYPGDIFHIHSKLLERAGNFKTEKGEVSITSLPVVETLQGDLTGYIQTNIMSMTDGHIYFDNDLYSKGRRPAINPFLSVTRVGHQTQTKLRQEINRELISFLTLFDKVQNYIHFGAELSENIKTTLSTGERIFFLFDQPLYHTTPINIQVYLFCMLWLGLWNMLSYEEMKKEMDKITHLYESDEKIREEINKFVESYDSFNKFLGGIKQHADKLFPKENSNPVVLNNQTTRSI